MDNALIIGDPHIQAQKLDVGEAFFEKVTKIIVDGKIETVIILGDLFHTFSIIRAEVLSAWCHFFRQNANTHFRTLVGNHDLAGMDGGAHALEAFNAFDNNMTVIDEPWGNFGICYVPFYRNNDEFIEAVKDRPERTLICHQSFNGAQFENGFYDPGGVDPKHVAHFKSVISGHIHKQQQFANIWYPGTPFQHNFGDAGQLKEIFYVAFFDMGMDGYKVIRSYDLGLPKYTVLKGHTLEHLKTVIKNSPRRPEDRYKIIGMGTPAEIVDFWADPEVKLFRSEVKQVIDAITPEKGRIFIDEVQGKSPEERLNVFIDSKEWRTSRVRVNTAARAICA
jgi:DNA repair exonuclease SbcCD nuclease subunit